MFLGSGSDLRRERPRRSPCLGLQGGSKQGLSKKLVEFLRAALLKLSGAHTAPRTWLHSRCGSSRTTRGLRRGISTQLPGGAAAAPENPLGQQGRMDTALRALLSSDFTLFRPSLIIQASLRLGGRVQSARGCVRGKPLPPCSCPRARWPRPEGHGQPLPSLMLRAFEDHVSHTSNVLPVIQSPRRDRCP